MILEIIRTVCGIKVHPTANIGAHVQLESGAVVESMAVVESGAVVGRGAVVKSRAVVESGAVVKSRAVIGREAFIASGAVVESRAVIGHGAFISRGAVIGRRSVIGHEAFIGRRAAIGSWAVIGCGAHIGCGVIVKSNGVVGIKACVEDWARISLPISGTVFYLEPYSITVTDTHLRIGCCWKSIKEWESLTREEAVKMGLPKEKYKLYRHMFEHIRDMLELCREEKEAGR